MKYLKHIVILMGLLIFFGTATILYIVFDRLYSKQNVIFPSKQELNQLKLNKNSEIINTNISDDKLILTIKLNEKYQIIVFDLKTGKKLYFFDINK